MSFSNEQAAIAAEARITEQHVRFREHLKEFARRMAADADRDARREHFFELLGHVADFANVCEQSVGDASLLGATRNESWAKNKAETSLNALGTILLAHDTIETLGADLGLPEEAFAPSPTAYASIQRHVAIFFPDRVDELRRKFEHAGLPVVGFDEEAPRSARRHEVRTLLQELRPLMRDASRRSVTDPAHSMNAAALSAQLVRYEAEGARLLARDAQPLVERWERAALHRHLGRREDASGGDVTVDAIAGELAERIAILESLDERLAKDDAEMQPSAGAFFHVLACADGEEPAIANDLSREQLLELVKPLKAGKAVRLDGRVIDATHPHLKIARTERNAAHFLRELELYRKRTGNVDFSVDPRRLPIDKGNDVTAEFLGAVASKKWTKRGGNAVSRVHNTIIWFAFILGVLGMLVGVVALLLRATGTTKLTFVGLGLDTSSVGVGCLVVGFFTAWMPWRSVLRNMKELEEIRARAPKSSKSDRS